jgi:hypothetical protein
VDEILTDLQRGKNLRVLVLDSCRGNPFAEDLKPSVGLTRSARAGLGLGRMQSLEAPEGIIISYSTQFFGKLYLNGKLQVAEESPTESLFWRIRSKTVIVR